MVIDNRLSAVASREILDEYQETIDSLLEKYHGKRLNFSIEPLFSVMEIIQPSSRIAVCRDPDDDNFISCAMDGKYL